MTSNGFVLRILTKNQSPFTIATQSLLASAPAFQGTFERAEFYQFGASSTIVVIDVIPAAGTPDKNQDSFVAVTTDATNHVTSITFRGLIRCFLSGDMEPYVVLEGSLVPDGAGGLRFDWLTFGQTKIPRPGKSFAELVKLTTVVPQQLDPVLPGVLGLKLRSGRTGEAKAGFVSATQPAQPGSTFGVITDNTYVIRFTRNVVLERTDQTFGVGPVSIALPASAIAASGLDGRCGSSIQACLVQTHLALNSDGLLDPPSFGSWAVTFQGLPSESVIELWNAEIARPYLAALGTVSSGQPISCIPSLAFPTATAVPACRENPTPMPPATTFWLIVVTVTDQKPGRGLLRQDDFGTAINAKVQLAFRSLQVLTAHQQANPFLQCNATWQGIICHHGDPLQARVELFSAVSQAGTSRSDNVSDQSYAESATAGFVCALLPLYPPTPFTDLPQRVRVGALDLEFAPVPASDLDFGTYKPDPVDQLAGHVSQLIAGFQSSRFGSMLPDLSLKITLRVERLTPGGQDNLDGEQYSAAELSVAIPTVPASPDQVDPPSLIEARFVREPPVVILSNDVLLSARFTLQLVETASGTSSQTVSMSLYMRDNGAGPQNQLPVNDDGSLRLVVIDRQPFMLARVHAPAFVGLGGADGSGEVAVWLERADGGASWELTGSSSGNPLVLPPQSLGERMEGPSKDPSKDPNGIAEKKAIGFALSPPANISLKASAVAQNYTEASWNLRRILGNPSPGAGAGVNSTGFELLYGLPCSVSYPFLILSELTARLGAVPGSLPPLPLSPIETNDTIDEQNPAYQLVRTRWSRLYRSLLSRLAVLEPWDADQTGTLSLSTGVQYAFRNQANIAYTGPNLAYAGALPSTDGILSRLYFSALGGWGYQKAIFRNGLFTVISDTSMGRTSYYSVEFKGRIGVFWNVAKLVEVYERTVAPSAQYAPTQDQLLGRPIIRLVESYVEILQPVRSFPDFGAAPTTNGFVQSLEFVTKKISVNLTWMNLANPATATANLTAGRVTSITVNTPGAGYKAVLVVLTGGGGSGATAAGRVAPTGAVASIAVTSSGSNYTTAPTVTIYPAVFQIPLWQRDADPKIYPKPQVGTRHPVPAGSGLQDQLHEFDSPDMLFFYTDQSQGADPNTDNWRPVSGLDYPDGKKLPIPAPGGGLAPNPDDPAPTAAQDPGLDNDFGSYTFPLSKVSIPTNVTAQRVTGAIGSVLDSITMVRANISELGEALTADDPDDTTLQLLAAFGDPPNVNGLQLNQDKLTYYFDQAAPAIGITPSGAWLNNLPTDPPQLKALGVRLPTSQLLDHFVPDELDGIDFTRILPNFAGLNLEQLLPDLEMPAGIGNNITITHEFDPQTQRGWVQAVINIPIAGPTTVFSAGPVLLTIQNIVFAATVKIDAGTTGTPQQNSNGSITADWMLQLGGQQIVTFVNTSLTFDQTGKTSFNLYPKNVQLNGVLQLLSAVLSTLSDPDSGFTLQLVQVDGLPVGVEAILDLPIPDIAFGVCALSNLEFGASFGLELKDIPDFALSTSVNVSDEDAPFAIIIFILGGCGWVEVQTRYLPFKGQISTDLTIGIGVGAELEIAFGPVKGAIYAFLSVSFELHMHSGASTTLTVSISLVLGGEVDLLGLVSVSITLLLELEYTNAPSSLIGRGTLSVSVKICWLLTINVSYSVEKRIENLGTGSSSRTRAAALAFVAPAAAAPAPPPPPNYVDIATQYLATLE